MTGDHPFRWQPGKPWIAVDLDGTLAMYAYGTGQQAIGTPISGMKQKVIEWTNRGLRVKIFTARVAPQDGVDGRIEEHTTMIQDWLVEHGMPRLEVTCIKDPDMMELYDDRAVGVVPNEGILLSGSRRGL